jgi:diguanylate cyclase (GGDEF)-like protein
LTSAPSLASPRSSAAAPAGDWSGLLRRYLPVGALLFLLAVAAGTWFVVEQNQRRLIEYKALTLAEVVARQAAASRSTYTEHVSNKLAADGVGRASEGYAHEPGNVPLPAQFLKLVGQRASADADGLYRYRPLSKWNLGEGQHLQDDFQRWAWARLEAQDQAAPAKPIAWQSVWRVEQVQGEPMLRYLRADPASTTACVACHNASESRASTKLLRQQAGIEPGKQWRQHQLLGALEVQVPLAPVEALAADQRREILMAVLGLTLAGLACLGLLVYVGARRARALTQDLAWRAGHDDLTGLINRPQFEQRLAALLEQARQRGGQHALMFLDLDQFKIVNDTCGHQAGDELLRQIGERLRGRLRASDTLARLGGDEFGVLLADCPAEQAREVAHKLLQAVAEFRFVWRQRVFELGVSIGLVEVLAQSEGVADLMSAADMACYAAKEQGRHRVCLFTASDGELARRRQDLGWVERISRAMSDGRLALAVQSAQALRPELPVRRYQELLLRMFDEQGQPLPTGPVIAAAERYHLMPNKLDRWVLQTACEHVRAGRLRASAAELVAVNISGASLGDEGFRAFARQTLLGSGIDPRGFCFEITETAAIGHMGQAMAFMQEFKALGCKFALDDFGSGLSSFGYLKNLPVDFLKLDGAFVRDILSDPVDRAMVSAIHQVGRAIGIPTIAEWVETEEVCAEVARLGLDYAQGYGVEKPQLITPLSRAPGAPLPAEVAIV